MRYLLWLLTGACALVFSLDANENRNNPTHNNYNETQHRQFNQEQDTAGPENKFEYNLYDRMQNDQAPNQQDRQQYNYYQFKEGDNPPQFRRSRPQQQNEY
jgi:hypothetical protein